MGGGGSSAPNVITKDPETVKLLENRSMVGSRGDVSDLLARYGAGEFKLADALQKGRGLFGLTEGSIRPMASEQERLAFVNSRLADKQREMEKANVAKRYKELGLGRQDQSDAQIYDIYQKKQQERAQAMQAAQAMKMDPKEYLASIGLGTDEMADFNAESAARKSLYSEYDDEVARKQAEFDAKTKGGFDQFVGLLTTNPLAAEQYMKENLMEGEATKGLFGEGGLQRQAEEQAKKYGGIVESNTQQYQDLLNEIKAGDAFQLTEGDKTAYGQLSGDIARMYGQQENAAMESLASRGLAQAPSGAAGVMFSGLQGNKMEQLANAQRQVLNDRVNQAMQTFQLRNQALSSKGGLDLEALSGARGTAGQLGSLYENAKSNLFNRSLAGRSATEKELANAADRKLQNEIAYQNQLNTQFQQEQATKGPGFGDVLMGAGMMGLGAATGGFGGAVGTGLAGSLFGGSGSGGGKSFGDATGASGGKYTLGANTNLGQGYQPTFSSNKKMNLFS